MGKAQMKWLQPNVPFRPDRSPFFYGWAIMGASVMGIVSSMPGQTSGVGPFKEDLMASLDLTSVQISIAYLGGTAMSGLILPRIGGFFDRYGARLTGTLVEIAFGLSLFYMAACANIYDFLRPGDEPMPMLGIGLLMLGFFMIRFLGQGVIAMTSRAMLGKWFNRKRGIASAIAGALGGICFSGAPLILFSIVEWLGWRGAYIGMGLVLMFGFSALCWFFYRDNPEECGLIMDGEAPPDEPTGPTDPEFTIYKEFTAPEAIRTYAFWAFTAAFSMNAILITAVAFHAVDMAREFGRETAQFYRMFLFMTIVNIPTGLFVGWMTERVRLKPLLMAFAVGLGGAAFGLEHLSCQWGMYMFIVSGGFSSAFFGTLMAVVYPRFFGRQHLGAITGWAMLTLVICSAASPLIWSLSESLTGTYGTATWGFAGLAVLLFFAAMFANNPQRKLKPTAQE